MTKLKFWLQNLLVGRGKTTDYTIMSNDGVTRYYFDASVLKDAACLRRLYWTAILSFSPKGFEELGAPSVAIAYGNACHKFAEHMARGTKLEDNLTFITDYYTKVDKAIAKFDNYEYRTLSHLLATCRYYHKIYSEFDSFELKLDKDGNKMVEKQFAFPFWKSKDGLTELILCGTIDGIGSYAGEPLVFNDHKTTTSYYNNGEYFKQYMMDLQMQLYSWALRKLMKLDYYPPCIITGWFIKKPTIKNKEKEIWDGVRIERSNIIAFSEERMKQFLHFLQRKLALIITFFENDITAMENELEYGACKSFGLCKFHRVCSVNPSLQSSVLETTFTNNHKYEPLKFRE